MIKAYERAARRLLQGEPKAKPRGRITFDGKGFYTTTRSLHRTKQSRAWRLFWRIKPLTRKFDSV
jgi:hypothetical protein